MVPRGVVKEYGYSACEGLFEYEIEVTGVDVSIDRRFEYSLRRVSKIPDISR